MGISIETLVAAKKFTSETVLGGGAVAGKNVTISSITPIDGGNRITFSYTLDNGTTKTSTLDVMNGKDGKNGSGSSAGEENVIESIKVNGIAQTVAEDKSVDITVPTVDVDKNYVDGEVGSLKEEVGNVNDRINVGSVLKNIEITLGKKGSIVWNNGNYDATGGGSTYATEPFEVVGKSKIYISGRFYNPVVGAFYGAESQSRNAVSVIKDIDTSADRTLKDYEITVPSGAKFCRLCSYVENNVKVKVNADIFVKEYIDECVKNSIHDSNLKGKKVVWFGTSIPAGGAAGNYPKVLADRLGFEVYNEAVGSSACRCGCHARITNDDTLGWNGTAFQNIAYSLSGTLAEKEEIIKNYSKYGWNVALKDKDKEYIRNCSYERKLDKYLSNGSVGQADLYVFDHGFNDALFHDDSIDELEIIPENKFDRTYYIGAMNFLVNRILEDNPKAKIIFIEHYQTDWSASAHVVPAQEMLAKYWNFPSCRVWESIGWTEKTVKSKGAWENGLWLENSLSEPNNYSLKNIWMADKLHPHSDLSGKALKHYADILEPFFKELSLND